MKVGNDICPKCMSAHSPLWDCAFHAQGIEAGTGETEGLDAKRESPVPESDAPEHSSTH
jgi:hypothetical protein